MSATAEFSNEAAVWKGPSAPIDMLAAAELSRVVPPEVRPSEQTACPRLPTSAERKLKRTLDAKRAQMRKMQEMSRTRILRHFISQGYLDELMCEVVTYEAMLSKSLRDAPVAELVSGLSSGDEASSLLPASDEMQAVSIC